MNFIIFSVHSIIHMLILYDIYFKFSIFLLHVLVIYIVKIIIIIKFSHHHYHTTSFLSVIGFS